MRGIRLIALVASACSFSPGALPAGDAGIDGPPPITVGFAKDATLTDESAGTESIRVVLSKPAAEAISVSFAVTGGTADRPNDYLLTDGTLTFAPGDVEETIDITIGPDGTEEPNETIELTLSSATGGAALAISAHTVTINANVLPRVTFSSASSTAAESASPTINAVLDVASQLTTSVQVGVMSGNATGAGVDYTLGTTIVTFNPGETTKPVMLTVHQDTLDEVNEDVTLGLANAVNLIVGATATEMHTITDDDAEPTVSFALADSSISEAGMQIDIAVTLSALSGKNFNVPFTIDNTSTAGGTDYTQVTNSPLPFTAGTLTQNIRINILQDTAIETPNPETVVLMLGTPSPMPNATLLAPTTHTLSIVDDDQTCLGRGATALCFPTPVATVAVAGAFNTDSSMLCETSAPVSGWAGGPSSCFVVGTNITVAATTVTGSRPLVLFASDNITVTGNLDAASHRVGATAGPGSNIGCGAYTDIPGISTFGAGGGAGGTFRTTGGNGGQGDGVANSGGGALAPDAAPAILRGGCTGQKGGDGFAGVGDNGGEPGAGGGALYLVAGGTITINSGVVVNASGAGATALASPDLGLYAGGGGGGSGGMIKLSATTFSVSGAIIMANGGGGSTGADDNTTGVSGNDPSTSAAGNAGQGGTVGNGGGNGGDGWGGVTAAQSGGNGSSTEGGGGGGGGGGYIHSNLPLTGASTSAGEIFAP